MEKVGLIFAGQGSQYPKMGYDFYNNFPYIQDYYKTASQTLGYDIKDVIFGDFDKLNQTLYTQPSLLLTSIIIYEVIKKEFNLNFDYTAGFSLGEYSALYASGVFDFTTSFNLIKKRATFLEEDSKRINGTMGAVIGLSEGEVEALVNQFGDIFIANYNSPIQTVVSGPYEKMLLFKEKISSLNKRFIPLNVSGAFHSIYMENASKKMLEEVNKYQANTPRIPLICNYNAEFLDITNIDNTLSLQIKSPVQFSKSITKMIDLGVNLIIEIGPGSVLSGFVRKINSNIKCIFIDKVEDLKKLGGE